MSQEDLEKELKLVDKMISRKDALTDIYDQDGEYYFKYRDKYAWSIVRRTQSARAPRIFLYLYPEWTGSSEELARRFADGDVADIKVAGFASLSASDEGKAQLGRLRSIIRAKYLNVDRIVDDILNDE